jgi:hypothetical protein
MFGRVQMRESRQGRSKKDGKGDEGTLEHGLVPIGWAGER